MECDESCLDESLDRSKAERARLGGQPNKAGEVPAQAKPGCCKLNTQQCLAESRETETPQKPPGSKGVTPQGASTAQRDRRAPGDLGFGMGFLFSPAAEIVFGYNKN